MKILTYKIKNKLYKISNEGKKIKRPSYEELKEYKNFTKNENNKFALSFGAGRSGQNWFTKIFNNHSNWIGTCERFVEYETFFRYITYYSLPINKEGIFELFELASKRDMAKYQNTFIASPYLSFGIQELTNRLNPDYLFFHIRDPIKSVESFYKKNWYLETDNFGVDSPIIDTSLTLHRTLSRIVPKNDHFKEWLKLTRIGKITWFWATINKNIFNEFDKIKNKDKFFVKLEDVDQNYEIYEKLVNKFNFENKMTKNKFYNVINNAPNRELEKKYEYINWSNKEKKEFEYIIKEIFPKYNEIITNL